jgi:hypothetical protein
MLGDKLASTAHSGDAAGSGSSTVTSSATPLYRTPRERVGERRLIDHAPACYPLPGRCWGNNRRGAAT